MGANLFPQASGVDLQSMTPVVQLADDASTGATILEVSNASGLLVSIHASGTSSPNLGLTIDGVYKGKIVFSGGVFVFGNIPFKTGFKIQWAGGSTTTQPDIVYLLD